MACIRSFAGDMLLPGVKRCRLLAWSSAQPQEIVRRSCRSLRVRPAQQELEAGLSSQKRFVHHAIRQPSQCSRPLQMQPRVFSISQPVFAMRWIPEVGQQPRPSCLSVLVAKRWQGGRPSLHARRIAQQSWDQALWLVTGCISVLAFTFMLVPLYRIYCQHTGQGTAILGHKEYTAPPEPGTPEASRLIEVDFAATVHCSLPWEFTPQQKKMKVGLGETALAFYRAKSLSSKPLIGVSVYHMLPPEVGLYFNKIQCFCFNEQLLNPNEEVDLPVFFFIDPMLAKDSRFDHVDHISLSYVFFESDSDIPEEYKDYIRATPTTKEPPTQSAPAPAAVAAA